MSDLIPKCNWTDFLKIQKLGKLPDLQSCEVFFNGEYMFTYINGSLEKSGYRRTEAEYCALACNSVGLGKAPEDILREAKEGASVPV